MSADTADSATDPTPIDEIREAMAAATVDHEVELAIDTYEWANPLDVVDTSEPVEWDARFTDDWWTRSIFVEGGNGATYELVYITTGDATSADCYRYEDDDGRGDKRGRIESLGLVAPESREYVLMRGTSSGRGDVYHRPDSEQPDQPACNVTSTKGTWYRKHPEVLHDDWSLCKNCADDSETDDEEDDGTDSTATDEDDPEKQASVEAVLPEDISEADVSRAVGANKDGGFAEIGDVAETLDLPVEKTRTILVVLNLYSEVREVTSRKRGGRGA